MKNVCPKYILFYVTQPILLWRSSWSSLEFSFKTTNFIVMHPGLTGLKRFNAIIFCQDGTLRLLVNLLNVVTHHLPFLSWMNLEHTYKDD